MTDFIWNLFTLAGRLIVLGLILACVVTIQNGSPGNDNEQPLYDSQFREPIYCLMDGESPGRLHALHRNGNLSVIDVSPVGSVSIVPAEGIDVQAGYNSGIYVPSRRAMFLGTHYGEIRIAEPGSPSPHRRFASLRSAITNLAVTADERFLCAGDEAGHIEVWDLENGEHRSCRSNDEGQPVFCLFAAPDRIIAHTKTAAAGIWNPHTGERAGNWTLDLPRIDDWAFVPHTSCMVYSGRSGGRADVKLMDTRTSSGIWTTSLGDDDDIRPWPVHLKVLDEKRIAAGCGPFVWVLDAADGSIVAQGRAEGHRVSSIAWIHSTDQIVTASRNGSVRAWPASTLLAVRHPDLFEAKQ